MRWFEITVFAVIVLRSTFVAGAATVEYDEDEDDDEEGQLSEADRVDEYHKRNYTWPLPSYVPNTPGWKNLMDSRFHQIEEIEDETKRYNGYMQVITSAFFVPNFTEHGFGLARCPPDLLAALQRGIRDGLPHARLEHKVGVIDGPQSLFIDRVDLSNRVLHELKHYAETWANMPLTPHLAYGLRLYQNDSQLHMHVDKIQTHIISFILHIDSSEDAEPWPIYIEDYHGRTHEVILKPGDMLFYESSKCFHGRPKRLKGSWYCSIFVHYYPSHNWDNKDHEMESHYAVPEHWFEKPPAEQLYRKLEMVGTGLTEPGCPNSWCRTMFSVKWSVPAEEGYLIDPTGEKHPFNPTPKKWNDEL